MALPHVARPDRGLRRGNVGAIRSPIPLAGTGQLGREGRAVQALRVLHYRRFRGGGCAPEETVQGGATGKVPVITDLPGHDLGSQHVVDDWRGALHRRPGGHHLGCAVPCGLRGLAGAALRVDRTLVRGYPVVGETGAAKGAEVVHAGRCEP